MRASIASVLSACAVIAACALAPSSASADAIMPPPEHCPEGSNPSSSHAGAYCAVPYPCRDTGCSPGDECRTVHVCVQPRSGYSNGGPFTVDEVVASCSAGSTCADGSPCQERTGCVTTPPSIWTRALPESEDDSLGVMIGAGAALCGCVGAPLLAMLVIALVRARASKRG